MAISEATIREFQQVVKEDYGQELSLAQAAEILRTWVGYFDLLARIASQKNDNDNEKTKLHKII